MEKLTVNSKVTLNNGVQMPVIGLGTYKAPEGEEVIHEVTWALHSGYRLIDTAKVYKNEEGVGKAIKESGIPREEIFVTTKLWNPDQGYESGLKAIDESLSKLGLGYVDLYLVHWPTADPDAKKSIDRREVTWRAMEEIYKSGKAKAIGVSNYTIRHLEEMKKYATIFPTVNQVEFHPYLFQKELLDYCKANNIVLEAYRPLTNGKRIENEVLDNIAKKYGKTNAQILIRWSLEHGCVPLPKSVHKERVEENINVFNFELSEEDMKAIDALNENARLSPDPTDL
jgi:methylglyoxal/glyoxal reductase